MTQLAIIQKTPVFLDRQKTIELAVASVEEAAAHWANLFRQFLDENFGK